MKRIIDGTADLGANGDAAVIVITCVGCNRVFATDEYSLMPNGEDGEGVTYLDDCPICGALNSVDQSSLGET